MYVSRVGCVLCRERPLRLARSEVSYQLCVPMCGVETSRGGGLDLSWAVESQETKIYILCLGTILIWT